MDWTVPKGWDLNVFVFQPPQFGSGYSSIDPDMVDLNLYPDASKVEWTYSTLGPGDCIFIPSGKHPLIMFLSTLSYFTMLFNNTMNFIFTLKIETLVLCFCLNDHLNLVKQLFNHAFSLSSVEKNNNHQRWFQTFPLDLLNKW